MQVCFCRSFAAAKTLSDERKRVLVPTKRGASHAAPRAMSTSLSPANMFAVELF